MILDISKECLQSLLPRVYALYFDEQLSWWFCPHAFLCIYLCVGSCASLSSRTTHSSIPSTLIPTVLRLESPAIWKITFITSTTKQRICRLCLPSNTSSPITLLTSSLIRWIFQTFVSCIIKRVSQEYQREASDSTIAFLSQKTWISEQKLVLLSEAS